MFPECGQTADQITLSSAHIFDHAGERLLMAIRELMAQRLRPAASN